MRWVIRTEWLSEEGTVTDLLVTEASELAAIALPRVGGGSRETPWTGRWAVGHQVDRRID